MHDRDIQWLYDRVQLQTKVIISRFHTSPEYEANKLGYRVVSWSGRKVKEEQIGMLTLVDRADIYWKEPNGQTNESENGIAKRKICSVLKTKRWNILYRKQFVYCG